MSDSELLSISYNKPSYFGELFDRYNTYFFAVAKNALRSEDEAEDVVQETFVKIYKYGSKFLETEGNFKPWATTILRNCIADQIRTHKTSALPLTDEMEAVLESVDEKEEYESSNYVQSVLSKIGGATAEVLKLRFVLGKSYKEIGRLLGISSVAARVRIHRAKKNFSNIHKQLSIYGR